MKRIAVYAASSDAARDVFGDAAATLGRLMAVQGIDLIYGAGKVGLMGAVAEAVHAGGGFIVGVIPERLNIPALTFEACDELVITETMAERKRVMAERADGFVVLPGGFGTLEEVLEVIVLKQLGYHSKPIVFLNDGGAFDGLMAYFSDLVDADLVKEDQCNLFSVALTPEAALEAVCDETVIPVSGKWTTTPVA